MKIIVIGDGKVGKTIIEHLANEGHDLIVIDNDPKVIEECVNTYDVRGICGNGANYDTQLEAGVDTSDLVIAVTNSDELNILCCLVAKKIGTKQTIARVRNPEYNGQIYHMIDELGLSMVVNPEYDAAHEISRILRFPSAIKIESFAQGKVDLVEIKLDESSPLVGKSLTSIHEKYQITVVICAVLRDDKVYIPRGDFILQPGDEIYITASPLEITKLFKKLNILKEKIKDVIIVGGGKITYYLALQLDKLGIKLKIIEKDYNRCLALSEAFPNAIVIHGDGTNQTLLMDEGLDSTDALVSVTGIDEENIIMSMFANTRHIDKIVTKVNRDIYGNILEIAGLDTIISPRDIAIGNIVRHVRGMETERGSEFRTLYKLVNNRVEALEFYISKDADYLNIPLKDLNINSNTLIASIIRNGQVIIPNGNDVILESDTIIVVSTLQIKDVSGVFK